MEFKIDGMDDIVEVILKSENFGYQDLKQRTIHKLKNILTTSKTPNEARLLLNIKTDFSKEEEEFYCHENYWSIGDRVLDSHNQSGLLEEGSDLSITDVLCNPMVLKECGKHLYYFLRKRKIQKIIDENLILHCENCRCTFTMLYRKHHCRSCGKVFCSTCCHKKIIVPKEFLSFQQYSIFSYFSKEERVCDGCYLEIFEFHSCRNLIRFFELVALEIPLIQKCATISKPWRKAVLFYLSFLREVQYKLLHETLSDFEIRFLYNNRNFLSGHSSWMLQLLKIETAILLENDTVVNKKISNCWECMCTRLCHENLDVFDSFVILIMESKYPNKTVDTALEILKQTSNEKWIYFLPFFFSRWPTDNSETNMKLFDFLIDLSKQNTKMYSTLYWGFEVCSFSKSRRVFEHLKEKLLLENYTFSKNFIGVLNLLSICEDYYINNDQHALQRSLSKLNHLICPIYPNRKIKTILVDEIKIKKSITTPLYIPYLCDDNSKCALLFKKEDIRKDATAMAMAKLCRKLLDDNHIVVPFISYEVIPTSPTSGFIEIVQQSKTLQEIFQEGTINNYLQIHNPEKKIGEILENYMKSLAFWTIFTYLLGVGDRHLENIMLTSDGVLFHIDYGFILGYETKPYVPLIRIDNAMIEGIGGNVQYEKFKSICIDMFLCLRRYSSLLFCCFLTFASSDPPIQNTKFTIELLENHIVDRFMLGQSETDVSSTISKLIDSSRDAVTLKVSDYIHTYASKMPTSKGIFSWFYDIRN